MPSSLPHYNQHTVQRQGPSQISAIHSLNVSQQNNERQSICWCFLQWKCLPANLALSLHVTEETHMLLLGCLSSRMSCRYDARPTDNVLFICLLGSRLSENSFVWMKKKSHRFKQPLTQMQRPFSLPFCTTPLHGLYFYYGFLLYPWKQKLWIKTSTNSHILFIYTLALIFIARDSRKRFPLTEMCLLICMCACVLTYVSLTCHALVHVSRRNAVCHACLMALLFTLSRMSTNYTTANLLTCLPAQQIKLLVPHFNQSHPQDLWCAPVKEAERCHVIRKTPLTEDLATRNWFPGVT